MATTKISAIAAVLLVGVLAGPNAVQAENLYYVDGVRVDPSDPSYNPSYPVDDVNDLWSNPNNWNTTMTGSGTYRVPVDGDTLVFGTNGLEYGNTDIDIAGATIYLPNSNSNCNRLQYRFIDTVGGGSITLKEFRTNYSGTHSVSVPLIANTVKTEYRVGNTNFHSTINTVNLDLGNGNVRLYGDVTVTGSSKFRNNGNVTVYLQPDPAVSGAPTPTLTTPVLDVLGASTKAHMNGFVVSPAINIYDGATYNANINGSMGNASTTVTISNAGKLVISSAQSGAGTVNVDAGGFANFNAAGINLANLGLNTAYVANTSGAQIAGSNQVVVSGTVSGNGEWGGTGTLNVAGTVAPGSSVGTLTGANLAMKNGSIYEMEMLDPDGTPGTGWDLIIVGNWTFEGAWTLALMDLGISRDILPSESFVIAQPGSTNFDPANVTIETPDGWRVGPGALSINNDGDLVLTNLSTAPDTDSDIPEPASMALLGLAACGLGGYVRRRRKA